MKKIIIIILIILTTGCWDQREIKDLGITNSFLFDYKDGKIIFMAEVVNPKTQSSISSSPAGTSPYIYIRGEGEKILDATNNSTLTLNKYLYNAHLKAIFITEAFAKEKGILPLLDLFSRYPELRQSEYIVVIKGENQQALYKSSVSLADFFGDFVDNSESTQSYRLSKSVYTKMLDMTRSYYSNTEEPVVGVIEKIPVSENEVDKDNPLIEDLVQDNTKVIYEGFAVFKKEKLKYVSTGEETLLYNLIVGKAKAINIDVGKTTFKILSDNPKVDIKYKDDKVKIDIQLDLEMLIVLDEGKHNFNNLKTVSKLQKEIDEKLSKGTKELIDKAQTTIGVDFFSLASKFHIKYPKEWKKISKKWDKYFQEADINIKVKSNIKSQGKLEKSIKAGK